jgi:hypothetical protein
MTLESLFRMPLAFWTVLVLLGAGGVYYLKRLRNSIAVPMLAVLGTTAAWYVGDAFYNDYANYFVQTFQPETLSDAWWQVDWFLVVLLFAAPRVHRSINARYLNRPSYVLHLLRHGVDNPQFQGQINRMLYGCVVVWAVLVTIAVIRLEGQILYFFFPFLGERADPWGRGRIGVGIDALLSIAAYIQLFTGASFGVVAAVATNFKARLIAIIGCLLTWPYYLFDRTRNTMLAVMVPAILMWVFFRLRGSLLKKLLFLLPFFILISVWLSFVIANRSDTTVLTALKEKGLSVEEAANTHHEGLNMYEELCWINSLIAQGTYKPNWGERYYAELVNPIPRSLFPNKPLIGLDYAVARGQGNNSADGSDVNATIATGMIGQGVVNFGVILGPACSALLMSLWVAILARLDLNGDRLGRIPLFALGIILTFNLGRDITFITLYTFVFGALLIWIADRQKEEPPGRTRVLSSAKVPLRRRSAPKRLVRAARH